MRIGLLVTVVSLGLAASGCVFVSSHSYAYTQIDRRPPISESDWTYGVLHLTAPLIENLVVDLTHSLERRCGGAPLANVQTKLVLRELVLVQFYSVQLTGTCGSPPAGALAPPS